MPVWLEAAAWGLLAGGALVLGALVAWFVRVPQKVVAGVMAFGATFVDRGRWPDLTPRQRAILESPNARYAGRETA